PKSDRTASSNPPLRSPGEHPAANGSDHGVIDRRSIAADQQQSLLPTVPSARRNARALRGAALKAAIITRSSGRGRQELDTVGDRGAAPPGRALRWPRPDRYLAANISLWLLTYLLITIRGLGMDTPIPVLFQMAGRRAVVCIAAVFFCMLIQRVLLKSRPWPWT